MKTAPEKRRKGEKEILSLAPLPLFPSAPLPSLWRARFAGWSSYYRATMAPPPGAPLLTFLQSLGLHLGLALVILAGALWSAVFLPLALLASPLVWLCARSAGFSLSDNPPLKDSLKAGLRT